MPRARIDQINVVVPDVAGAIGFLRHLGVDIAELPPAWAAWAGHHQSVPSSASLQGHAPAEPSFGIDLDSPPSPRTGAA